MLHLAVSTNSDGYSSALYKTWENCGLQIDHTPSKSSLSEYRKKVSWHFFKDLFSEAFQAFERKTFRGFYIYAIDGDIWNLPASEDILNNKFRGAHFPNNKETHYPKMYTASAVDVVNGVLRDFRFCHDQCEVVVAREMVKNFEKNSLTIYDRFHGTYASMKNHENAGNYFLIRARVGGPTTQSQLREFRNSNAQSKTIDFLPSRGQRKELTPVRVRLIKVKNPRTQETLIFMTNLPQNSFKKKEIGLLYLRRWDIETTFKDLSHTLKMGQWHSKSLNGILQEVYALFWFYNAAQVQCLGIINGAEDWLGKIYEKTNFKLCAQFFIDHIEMLWNGQTRQFHEYLHLILKRAIERRIRLRRSYPRAVRGHGATYANAGIIERRP